MCHDGPVVAIIDSGDISELLARRSLFRERKDYTSVAWRRSDWKGAKFHLALLLDDESHIRWIGRAQGRQIVSDRERRVDISEIEEIDGPAWQELEEVLPERHRQQLSLGILPEAMGRAVTQTLVNFHPSYADTIQRLSRQTAFQITASDHARRLNEQRDGTGLLLEIGGIGRESLRQVSGFVASQPSFLAGISDRSVSEESIISHDVSRFPGLAESLNAHVDWRMFEGSGRRMFVMNTNMEPLEQTLGVDVLYYSESERSFVLVQYKRLVREASARGPAKAWYRPDKNLEAEMKRMEVIDESYGNASNGCFRLHSKACWVKLCDASAQVESPMELIKGMYLAREYFQELLASLKGPRGGVLLGYENVPRHVNNTTFIQLVKDGWIGTRGTGTVGLERVVADVLRSRRALVLGIAIETPSSSTAG